MEFEKAPGTTMFSFWVQFSDIGIATKTREQKPSTPPL
jgi:hypothetical protein